MRVSPFQARPAWQLGGAVVCVVLGIWAGVQVYSHHAPARGDAVRSGLLHNGVAAADGARRGLRQKVPAGEASAPSARDLDPRAGEGTGVVGSETQAATRSPAIPDALPDFTLADLTGKPTPISNWRGKSLVLNFWATWCAPCRREMPLLQSLARDWAGKNVEVVGIAVDYREKVLDFAKKLKISYPQLVGEQDALDAAAALGMTNPAFPFTVFTDHRGQVVALFVGELHKPQADLILNGVQALDLDRSSLENARLTIALGLDELAVKN